MKCKILKPDLYSYTGSKIISAIMDTETPMVDLLVRESIQNSADAHKKSVNFVRIDYDVKTFNSLEYISLIKNSGFDTTSMKKKFDGTVYKSLIISDTNTYGLLGGYKLSTSGEPQNLYNLVYDMQNGKTEAGAGGSWGIGKSVYYRFGVGFCIFYTRTFEGGVHKNKLVMTLIEDGSKQDRLIRDNTRGIALFGSNEDEGTIAPIYDDYEIKKILDIFDVDMFNGTSTGTKIIIPYFKETEFVSMARNKNINDFAWANDAVKIISMAVQRWYFPRLRNDKYNGVKIRVLVNGEEVILNPIFELLQKLYNDESIEGKCSQQITYRSASNVLGTFSYKKFNKEELRMIPPYNYPNPYAFFDVSEEGLEGVSYPFILFTRKPGMILNYDENIKKISLSDDTYVIGIFKLNDEFTLNGEKLGEYFRKSEKANHKGWCDALLPDFPSLSSLGLFKFLQNKINNIIEANFKTKETIDIDSTNTATRKKLAKMLLPPDGFGNTPTQNPKGSSGGSSLVRKSKALSSFSFDKDGNLVLTNEFKVKNKVSAKVSLLVKSGNKKYSIQQWINLNFEVPFEIKEIELNKVKVNKLDFGKRSFSNLKDKDSFNLRENIKITFNEHGEIIDEVYIENYSEQDELQLIVNFILKPKNFNYDIDIKGELNPLTGGADNE